MTSKINSDIDGSDIVSSSSSNISGETAKEEVQKVDSQSQTPQTVEVLAALTPMRLEENKTDV